MAQKASSFGVDFRNEADMSTKREMPLKSGKSLVGALRAKYCTEHDGNDFGYITVFGGRQRRRTSSENAAELEYLTNVCLSNSNIRKSGLDDLNIISVCPNIVDLDVSGNNLDSWKEILPVIQQLKNLKFLNIARNMITKDKDELYGWERPLPGLENLVLNETGIKWEEVLQLAKLLPHLKELHICGNSYSEIPAGSHDALASIHCLRMNNNCIANWDQVWKLRYLPNLKSLILSGNPLMDIFYGCDEPKCTCICHNDSGNSVTNSNRSDEEFHIEVRQYCENILNTVIDDIIRYDVLGRKDVYDDGKDFMKEDDKMAQTNIGFQNKSQTPNTKVDNISFVNGNSESIDIEELSRQIVETVLKRAVAYVTGTKYTETLAGDQGDLQKNDIQNDFKKFSENKHSESADFLNGWKESPVKADDTEELAKGEHSHCSCEGKPNCDTPFSSLETLCVSETHIGKWKHLSALRGFPALKAVRIKNVKLGCKLDDEDRRKLFVASLPNIKILNGSEVLQDEREKSERHLLRHFYEKKQKPDIYHILEQKHGKLTPLVDIDISKGYRDYATLTFVYRGKEAFSETVCVREPMGSLRKLIRLKLNRNAGMYGSLYHKFCNSQHEEMVGEIEEIRGDCLPMSRLDILDGDEIHIDDTGPRVCSASVFNRVS